MKKITRAAILSCSGDPFVALLFLYFFKKVWSDEVDKLYVHYDGLCDCVTTKYIERKFKEHSKVVWLHNDFVGLTASMDRCFNACQEDIIVLLEDDGYIYKKGVLDKYFKMIESGEYDFIGSPRSNASQGILERCFSLWNLRQPFYDPCFSFIKREHLMRTDHHFGPKNFMLGEYIKELDWTTKEVEALDTFGWICMQLRARGETKFKDIPLYKIFPHYNRLEDTLPEGWIHVGSLSTGWRGDKIHGCLSSPIQEGENLADYEKRVVFWIMAVTLEEYNEVADLKRRYLYGIEKLIMNAKLNRNRIESMLNSFKAILGN